LTGDRFPLPVNTGRVDGRAVSTSRVDGPSTRVVNSGSGNRALPSFNDYDCEEFASRRDRLQLGGDPAKIAAKNLLL